MPRSRTIVTTCLRCGFDFQITQDGGRTTPQTCAECPTLRVSTRGRGHPVYDMANELTTIRLAFRMIGPLLRMGRRREAAQVYADTQRALAVISLTDQPLPHPRMSGENDVRSLEMTAHRRAPR